MLWYEGLFLLISAAGWAVTFYNWIETVKDRRTLTATKKGSVRMHWMAKKFQRAESWRLFAQSLFVLAGAVSVITQRSDPLPRILVISCLIFSVVALAVNSIIAATTRKRAIGMSMHKD